MSKVFGIVLVIAILALGAYVLFGKSQTAQVVTPTPTIGLPEPTKVNQVPTDSQAVNELRAGGSSFRDPQGVFVVLYPSDYKLDTNDPKHPRIYKIGATQKGQTEMYDGVMVVFETIQLHGKSLSQWVDDHIKTATADGTSEVISSKKAFVLKTYPGFVYELRGLGTAKYFVLQKDAASNYAVVITTSVNDPKNVGFQTEVDTILSTLDLLK